VAITSRKAGVAGLAVLGLSAAALAGCTPAEPTDTFIPCMISDTGGFDDKSFNQLGFEGITEASTELGATAITVESTTDADYAPNLDSLVAEGCDLIVTVGFNLSAATVEYALANPDIDFAIVDDAADNDFNGETDAPNIKPILFDTAQAAFLAGYVAASHTETGKIGTYGGMAFPTVSIFMDGLAQGVAYYNDEMGTSVEVLGWDAAAQDGTFIGVFSPGPESTNAANNFLEQDVDVLLPVGGPIYQSAIEAIADSGKTVAMIGVDADLTQTDPANASYFLTSILKQIKVAVHDVVVEAGSGTVDYTPYIGTLENGGVGIAPFHDFESVVTVDAAKLDELSAGIIDGSIPVTSYLAG